MYVGGVPTRMLLTNLIFFVSWDSFVSSAVMTLVYSHLNKKKVERCARENIDESRAQEFAELNDASPLFRYGVLRSAYAVSFD